RDRAAAKARSSVVAQRARPGHDAPKWGTAMSVEQSGLKILPPNTATKTTPRGKPLIEGFKWHRVGLEIDEWVDQRTWYEFGKLLQQVDYAWEWMVADWLAFGDHRYGDQVYASAARLFGKAARTWEDYAYVARNVRISERSEILPVMTHKAVARFADDPELQRSLLAIAEQHGLSKAVFESVIELAVAGKSYQHLLPSHL